MNLINIIKEEYKNILKEEDYKGEHEAPDRESGYPLHDVRDIFGKDFYNLSIDEIVRQFGSYNSYDRNVAYIIKSHQNKPNSKIKIYRAIPDFNKEVKDKIKDLSTIIDYYDKYRFYPPSYKNKKLNNIVYDYENKIKNNNQDIKYDDLQKQIYEYLWKDMIELRSKKQKYEINPGDWVTIIRDYAIQHGKNELRNYIVISKTVYADEIYTEGYLEEWGYDPRTNSKSINEYLNESFFDKFKKKDIFNLKKNTWTHLTNSEELIKNLINGHDFIGKKEDLTKFNIPQKGNFAIYTNQHSPNFKKGGIFNGFELHQYLITTELPDDAFQPNWNSKNYNNLNDSQNVGVLKPEYRDSKKFKLWKRNKNNEFELVK